MGEKGFKAGEVKCSCGDSFDSVGELLTHSFAVHGLTADEVNGPDKQMDR